MADDSRTRGLRKGLTSYGDRGFSLFLRKAFIKGAGYTDDALTRPVIGIADTRSAFNPCHGNAPQLLDACDKTVPAQLMGAASAGVPCVQLVAGSMLTGSHRGERVGACTDCRRYWGRFRAGEI